MISENLNFTITDQFLLGRVAKFYDQSQFTHKIIFSRRHSNKFSNLIGSLHTPDFPISTHRHGNTNMSFFPFVYKELDSKSILLHNYCVGDYAFGVLYSYWRGSFNISKCKYKWIVLRVLYNAEFLVSLLGRAFKVMKNGIHFIICDSILGCEVLKILIYAN